MKFNRWLLTAMLGSQFILNARAAEDGASIEQLKQQIQELDHKLRVLERNQELENEATAEKTKAIPAVSLGSPGLAVRTADSNFLFKLRGYLQADARFYPDDYRGGTANDTFLIRRARPILEGTVYEKYDYRLMLDFGSGISSGGANNGFLQDGYFTARFLPEFQVQAGKMKEPVGLERLQSGANLLFVERAYPTQLVPNRDVGVQLQGDVFGGLLRYEAGVFNGVADGSSGDIETSDDEKDVAARLFASPFKASKTDALRGLGFGIAGTYGNQDGSGLVNRYRSPGQQTFFTYRSGSGSASSGRVTADGNHWRLAPQFYYYWGPFGVLGEYVLSDQELRLDAGRATFTGAQNTAWQVAVSYVLTGEENSWRGFNPKRPFNPGNGGWGAWEVAARVSQLDVDDDLFPALADPRSSATLATSYGLGVNWHLNKNVKVSLNYEQTEFDGGTTAFLQNGEKAILARAQVSF